MINIKQILQKAIKEQELYMDDAFDWSKGDQSLIYSEDGGQIDSLGLVTIIADIESESLNQHNLDIRIANETSLSLENSPFRTLESMVNFIFHKVEEKKSQVA